MVAIFCMIGTGKSLGRSGDRCIRLDGIVLAASSPNRSAYAERWVRSVWEEHLSKVIQFGERSLRLALNNYADSRRAESLGIL
jgi:hypothetical protein